MEFEIIDIKTTFPGVFQVEIEILETRKRKFFTFPVGDGWEKEINGESRFISDIKHRLQQLEEKEQSEDYKKFKTNATKLTGKKFKSEIIIKKKTPQVGNKTEK